MTIRRLPTLLLLLLFCLPTLGGERMSPELLWKLGRISGGAISHNSKVAYTVRRYELAKNAGTSTLYLSAKEAPKAVVSDWKSISSVQWGKGKSRNKIFFVGMEDGKKIKASQVFTYDVESEEVAQVSDIKSGVSNFKLSPNGKHFAFTAAVKMDPTVNEIFKDLPKADARIIDGLMYRHWNAWHDYSYSHIHVADIKEGKATNIVDVMKGLRVDCPLPPFGGAEQFNWSPDSKELAFTAKIVNNWAESTDSGIYLIDRKGQQEPHCITPGLLGYDTEPVYSPDGRWIAFHSMERPSFEADRNRVMLFNRSTAEIHELTTGLDQTAHGATWTADSSALIFMSERFGTNQLFKIDLEKNLIQLTEGRFNWSLKGQYSDGKSLLVGQTSMLRPLELVRLKMDDQTTSAISDANDEIYSDLELPKIEERWVRATDGKKIHNWVIFPPDFDPKKKWPAIVYCQGGPQGQIGQWFSYRWNFHLMASQGYVVMAVNRRGLPGFGRAWNDQISKDWGGQAMKDILSSTDHLLAQSYVDRRKVGAVGASFGGYTVYWLMGNHSDRFSCMISHCGVFNLESMYCSTEELFFPNWDLGGPYWKNEKIQKDYDRFSPHRYVRNWKTPLLVVHGEKDFRVPITQGMEAFTAAQVQGVPSRFLYFPNEGHWVLGPQNGVLWHRIFFKWLEKYCKN